MRSRNDKKEASIASLRPPARPERRRAGVESMQRSQLGAATDKQDWRRTLRPPIRPTTHQFYLASFASIDMAWNVDKTDRGVGWERRSYFRWRRPAGRRSADVISTDGISWPGNGDHPPHKRRDTPAPTEDSQSCHFRLAAIMRVTYNIRT